MLHEIVIVDDETWVAVDLMENIEWEKLGYTISCTFQNSLDACRYLSESNPDVAIVDISMPGLNGLALIEKAKASGCTSAFVILTAYKDFSYAQNAIRLGVTDYILKPINTQEITATFLKMKEFLPNPTYEPETVDLPVHKLDEIKSYIDQNLNARISLQTLSDTFYLNRNYICNLFRKEMDCTFSQYLTDQRIKKAKKLLLGTNLTISDISARAGFRDEFYFNKVFKKSEGVSPGLFRQLNRV